MSARKKTAEAAGSDLSTARPQAGKPASRGLKGDSETRFTRAELAQLLLESEQSVESSHQRATALIDAAWQHGRVMPEADPAIWRQDACGAWMRREQVGRQTEFGWKIRSISTRPEQTADDLRPFQWRNDFDVASGEARCHVSADRSGTVEDGRVSPPRNL